MPAQYLTSKALIQEHCAISNDKAAGRLEGFVPRARLLLIDFIGIDRYNELLALPADDPVRQTASRAESYATVFSGMLFLNLRPTDLGGFSRIIGYADRQEELMGVAEVEKYRSLIWSQMVDLVSHIHTPDPDEGMFTGSIGMTAIRGEQW